MGHLGNNCIWFGSLEAPEMHSDPDYDSFLADDFALGAARSRSDAKM
jgi:hypothetical protein